MNAITDKAARQPDTKKSIYKLLDDSDEHVVGALLRIYSFQTADEQDTHMTRYENQMGFNALDAGILSDMSQQYEKKGWLSEKQIAFIRRTIKKYWGQLASQGFSPAEIKPFNKKDNGKEKSKFNRVIKVAKLISKTIEIKFSYPQGDNRFYKCVAAVKTLTGRKFVKDERLWKAPLALETVEKLAEWRFQLCPKLTEYYEHMVKKPEPTADFDIPGLQKELYPFQKLGVSYIDDRKGRALIGDEMGLGKTVQALAWLQLNPLIRPAVIVVPATVKLNWAIELGKWMRPGQSDVFVINGLPDPNEEDYQYKFHQVDQADRDGHGEIIIINYDILANKTKSTFRPRKPGDKTQSAVRQWDDEKEIYVEVFEEIVEIPNTGWIDILKNLNPLAVVGDEIQYIKSNSAYRTKAFKRLCKGVRHVIGLSGTPIINRPIEFFNPLHVIEPTLFPAFFPYAKRYCGATHNGWGWDFTGATNTDELHELVTKYVMLRRLKKEVLKELPDKVRAVVPIAIDNRAEYRSAENDIIGWIRKNEGAAKANKASNAEVLVSIEKLKQIAVAGKMKAAIRWINDFLESDEKLVVFAVHKFVIDELMKEFKGKAVRLDGSTPLKKRQEAIERFQTDDDIRLFVGNVKAAGVGITLTAASNTCFVELGWTPGEHDQAEDRVHRIGQEADSVTAYYLLADRTIENDISGLLDEKRTVLAAVLDGKDVEDESILSKLLKKVRMEND